MSLLRKYQFWTRRQPLCLTIGTAISLSLYACVQSTQNSLGTDSAKASERPNNDASM